MSTLDVEGPVSAEPLSPETGLQAVIDLLGKEPADAPADTPETEPQSAQSPPEKWDVKSVAERLQVDPAKLYELKVKASDGTELSVGELKDRYKSVADVEALRAEQIKARGEFEADQIRQAREIEALLSAIPRQHISPELVAAYQRQQTEYQSREMEALLRAIPEWADKGIVTADRKAIADYISQFGFPAESIDQINDHRLFRVLNQAHKDAAELKALKAKLAEADKPKPKVAVEPKGGKPQTEAQRLGQLKGAVTSGRISPQTAVERLLRSR